MARGDNGAPLTRSDVLACAAQSHVQLRATQSEVAQCLESLCAMNAFLNERLGAEAPNLSRLQAVLETAGRVLVQVQPGQEVIDMDNELVVETVAIDSGAAPGPAQDSTEMATSGWRSRAEACATLDALARYLMSVEPHSPVPFLIRRALHWGSMPLPELIAGIIREEGDLNRLVAVLGLKV